jgi:gliding motility-associated-like protein
MLQVAIGKQFYLCFVIIQIILVSMTHGNMAVMEMQVTARVTISELEHNYDGSPKAVRVRTVPGNLKVNVTYDGESNAPVNAGKYKVVAEVVDPFWRGSATETMTIHPIKATLSFGNTIHKYDGKAKNISVTTSPAGLKVDMVYKPNPPVNAGSYEVTAQINERNYNGSASTTMVIEKAQAEIIYEKLVELYDGTPKNAKIATEPKGLKVTTTYNNSGSPPSKAGKYDLKTVISENNYVGQKTAVFVINTAPVALRTIEIKVKEDAEPSTVDLTTMFNDPDPGDALTYSISRNTNETLFSNISINNHLITLHYRKDAYGKAELTVRATDKYEAWAESKIHLDIEPVNDAPYLEIDEKIVTFTPVKDSPVPIMEWARITDPDDEYMIGAQIFFNPRTYERNIDLLIFEDFSNIRGFFSRDAGTLNLTGIDTKENYEIALTRVKYDNRSEIIFADNRLLTIYVDDGKYSSNFVHKEIELVEGFGGITIPTAFTPNNDNVNNTWKINNLDRYPDAAIKVFNRSGQLVYESTEHDLEWDGTYKGIPAPVGSYYYIITIKSYDKIFTGHVTILR